MLKAYDFPGNIRELEAMIFDAVARCQGTVLSLESFKQVISGEPSIPPATQTRESECAGVLFTDRLPTLEAAEESLINEALARTDGNQGVAAGILGISRQALNKRLGRRRRSERQEAFSDDTA